MDRHRVRRLICVTGIGAGDSKGHGGFLYDRILQPVFMKSIYEDKDRQEAQIRASTLEWTIVRDFQFFSSFSRRDEYDPTPNANELICAAADALR